MSRIIERQHWYELPRRCCGTCEYCGAFGKEKPPRNYDMCDHPEHGSHMVKLMPETGCKDYKRGIVLHD